MSTSKKKPTPAERRILVFGNSGSGKSTLALALAKRLGLAHLDLDTVAWEEGKPGVRRSLASSCSLLDAFTTQHHEWVIEGCYTSLLQHAASKAQSMFFLNPGIAACIENCRARPWEPHKYASKEAQDKNLNMLLDWVAQYETRTDEFSLQQHQALFANYSGKKVELSGRVDLESLPIC